MVLYESFYDVYEGLVVSWFWWEFFFRFGIFYESFGIVGVVDYSFKLYKCKVF